MADVWVRYSDGREEKLSSPMAFTVGAVVAVVKKRDGSVIVTLAE